MIGRIRRAYFEERRSSKEIVRALSVSRATVRMLVRGAATEFKYERDVQPAPKLGEWVAVLIGILEQEAKLPRRERRSTQRLFEELRGRGYDGAHDAVHRFVKAYRDERARIPAQAHPECKDRTIWDVFHQDERPSLVELGGPFDGLVEKAVRATTTCLISADRNRYGVVARAAGRMVLVRSHGERTIVLLDVEMVVDHQRSFKHE